VEDRLGGPQLEDPPSPVLSVQEKIEKMWKRKVEERIDYNYMIQHKKGFRNPSIYEKLILHLDIDELGEWLVQTPVGTGPSSSPLRFSSVQTSYSRVLDPHPFHADPNPGF